MNKKEIAKEFTRQMLDPNELNKLRAGNKHAQRDPANTQGSAIKYGQLPDSTQTNRLYIFSSSFATGINKHANQSSESQPGRVVKAVPEIQKYLSGIATLTAIIVA